jgi:hypothetical protein
MIAGEGGERVKANPANLKSPENAGNKSKWMEIFFTE